MYIADLHIHSRYSRATSKDLTPERLDLAAGQKGIRLLGTGDFTHPAWRKELWEKMIPAEDGLYRLRDEYVLEAEKRSEQSRTRFVVSGEISSIYRQDGKVRKVHSLILLPGLEEAERLSAKLEAIGNIHSDGRPILGLSCHDLLEIMLDVCPEGMFIPAHIWTPHFSMFGACSGFDSVEECFGELAPYIHAVETGLSSDPPMNWRLSALDRFQLISDSDAHSPAKLGREANLLHTSLSYMGLKHALETGEGLTGTIEFFPEEGKYHFDGHRKCHVCLEPEEAVRCGGICPVCGKKLTMGVSHRILELADRPLGFLPENRKAFESLVPLAEVIAASTGRSVSSKKVQEEYWQMIELFGNEFSILREVPFEELRLHSGNRIAEGIRRLRAGQVIRQPGFDGEYGTIRLFEPDELANTEGQMSLAGWWGMTEEKKDGDSQNNGSEKDMRGIYAGKDGAEEQNQGIYAGKDGAEEEKRGIYAGKDGAEEENRGIYEGQNGIEKENGGIHGEKSRTQACTADAPTDFLTRLNNEQRQAAETAARSIAVIAGPGTGKTGTLAARIRFLIEKRKVKPSEITAVTFTNQAAKELRERLKRELPVRRAASLIHTGTFHSLCLELLQKAGEELVLADENRQKELAAEILRIYGLKLRPADLLELVSQKKTAEVLGNLEERHAEGGFRTLGEPEKISAVCDAYQSAMVQRGLSDFDDLLFQTLALLRADHKKARSFCRHFSYLLVDEFQDIDAVQYQLIRQWNRDGMELFVIGDPDQSIYGFRGADDACFARMRHDFPETAVVRLLENYRSTSRILQAACALIAHNPGGERCLHAVNGEGFPVRVVQTRGTRAEGIFTAKEISRMVGGIDMLDAQGYQQTMPVRSFSDIAVLCRTNWQVEAMEEYLKKEGIPYIVRGRGTFLETENVLEVLEFFRSICRKPDQKQDADKIEGTAGEAGTNPTKENGTEQEIQRRLAEKYRPLLKKKPSDLLKSWMEDRGLVSDDALQKLCNMALFYKTMEAFLHALDFGEEGDLQRCGSRHYTADAVSVMTLHASKGLEFPAVLIPGVRRYSIPLENREGQEGKRKEDQKDTLESQSPQKRKETEEERRLLFVGMTRAREELILITSGERSVFLSELPKGDVIQEQSFAAQKPEGKQMSLFDFGLFH